MTLPQKAKCRTPGGGVGQIDILDISEAGCLVRKHAIRIEPGERVLLKLPGLEYKAAYVAWVEDEQAGLSFAEPLYGPVLQHMLATMVEPTAA